MLRVFPHLSSSVGYITLVLSLSRLPSFYSSTLPDTLTHSLAPRSFSYCVLSLSQKTERISRVCDDNLGTENRGFCPNPYIQML